MYLGIYTNPNMHNEYQDAPRRIEAYLNRLSARESGLVAVGYILAFEGLLEQISDSKRKLMLRLVDEDDEQHIHELEARIRMLDIYEIHYRLRVERLSEDPVLQSIAWPVYT
jgi:hypothetical protein